MSMSTSRMCLAVVLLWGLASAAYGAPPVREVVATQVMAADTLRGHTLSLLARGEVAEAIDYWVLTTGKEAPSWLLALRTAFDVGKQEAGKCQGVARSIYTAFTQLRGKPELVELRTRSAQEVPYIMFKMVNGRDMNLSLNGYHLLVRMNDRAYDAYTGAAGMPWAEYLSRLGAQSAITQKVVEVVTEAP
ncbi:hypothetical protein [Vitiosangium sp. GDMCC 1.1324]|uniref:hypothetical protein n=1 Tax=Vitiosangium sp. (strain GDMCC 1.1324) TaxID=2138576 RepID=UPI000D34FA24|nr:hypothetical protein [Vitiosangium sp. GDMCC 1.1324]PTL77110.1 hypothetical protein DAT35_46590 [Vitiosangium sp. GDMCC 1.1324]